MRILIEPIAQPNMSVLIDAKHMRLTLNERSAIFELGSKTSRICRGCNSFRSCFMPTLRLVMGCPLKEEDALSSNRNVSGRLSGTNASSMMATTRRT